MIKRPAGALCLARIELRSNLARGAFRVIAVYSDNVRCGPARRTRVRRCRAHLESERQFMATKVVIVESPTKAKTISKVLGRSYQVRASGGHGRDLPKTKLGVDTKHEFEPQYLVSRDKLKTVKELRELVRDATTVYLATDPDREGEAIAWHIIEATGARTNGRKVQRITFHEITP